MVRRAAVFVGGTDRTQEAFIAGNFGQEEHRTMIRGPGGRLPRRRGTRVALVTVGPTLIDVWDLDTFDGELRDLLDAHSGLVDDYLQASRRLTLEREASPRILPYPENSFTEAFLGFTERLARLMERRSIRAWHYTRLTDEEVEVLRRDGIHLSTLHAIRARFDAQVRAGAFSRSVADRLLEDSPFRGEQHGSRMGKFWMMSHPVDIKDGGVRPLLGSWGGEAAHFHQRDRDLKALLRRIGRPRVIEVAMPLAASRHAHLAADAVVATFARTLGHRPGGGAFDLYADRALDPSVVLAVHGEGDEDFAELARGYPASFVQEHLTEDVE